MNVINVVLASSVVAGLLSVIVSFITTLWIRKYDFKADYYKEILKKRMDAYQFIENQISVLKAVALGDDKRPYHMIFSYGEDAFLEYQKNLFAAITSTLWIDDKTSLILEELNSLFFNLNNHINQKTDDEIEEIGKEYYNRISDLRFKLEMSVKVGLCNLHDIKSVFKTKKENSKRIIYKE
jgi:hypothetical protein